MDKLKIRLKKNSKKMCILFAALFVILCYVIGFLWSNRARKSFGISSDDVTGVFIYDQSELDFGTSDKDEIQIVIDQLNTIKLVPCDYTDYLNKTPDVEVVFKHDDESIADYEIVIYGDIMWYRGRQYTADEDLYRTLDKICKEGKKRASKKKRDSRMGNEDVYQ